MASTPQLGSRVVIVGKEALGEGTLRFYGKTKFKEGTWAGLEYPTACGKNNGEVMGVKYFSCPPNHGVFIPAAKIKVIAPPPKPAAAEAAAQPAAAAESSSRAPADKKPAVASGTGASGAAAGSGSGEQPKRAAAAGGGGGAAAAAPRVRERSGDGKDKPARTTVAISSKALEQEIAHLKGIIEDLKAEKAEAVEGGKDLQRELAELKEAIKAASKEKDATEKKHAAEVVKLKAQSGKELEAAKSQLQKELAAAQSALEEAKEDLEMSNLDKEIAEERVRELEGELAQAHGQIEILESSQRQLSLDEEASADVKVEELQQQNARLKEAIMKLRDLSVSDKHEAEKKLREATKEAERAGQLEEKLLKVESDLIVAEDTVDELKEQLEVAAEAEDIVEGLTEKNFELEQEVEELKAANEELESLQELSQELEEAQAQTEKELRSELYTTELRLMDLDAQMHNILQDVEDKDQTIAQYRERVKKLQTQLYEIQKEQEATDSEKEASHSVEVRLRNTVLQMQTRLSAMDRAIVDAKTKQVEAEAAALHLQLLKAYLPDSTMRRDNESVQCTVLLYRMRLKCLGVAELLRLQFDLPADTTALIVTRSGGSEGASNTALENVGDEDSVIEQRLFAYRSLCVVVSIARQLLRLLSLAARCTEPESLLKLAELQWEIAGGEPVLDAMASAMRSGTFSSGFDFTQLQSAFQQLRTLANRVCDDSATSGAQETSWVCETISLSCNLSVLELQRVGRTVAMNTSRDGIAGSMLCDTASVLEGLGHAVRSCHKVITRIEGGSNAPSSEESAALHDAHQLSLGVASAVRQLQKKLEEHFTQSSVTETLPPQEMAEMVSASLAAIIEGVFNEEQRESIAKSRMGGDDDGDKESAASAWVQLLDVIGAMNNLLSTFVDLLVATGEESPAVAALHVEAVDLLRCEAFVGRVEAMRKELSAARGLREELAQTRLGVTECEKKLDVQAKELLEAARMQTILEDKIAALQKTRDELEGKLSVSSKELDVQNKQWEHAMRSLQADIDALEEEKKELMAGGGSALGATPAAGEGQAVFAGPELDKCLRSLRSAASFHHHAVASERARDAVRRLGALKPLPSLAVTDSTTRSIADRARQLERQARRIMASSSVISLGDGGNGATMEFALQRKSVRDLQLETTRLRDTLPAVDVVVMRNDEQEGAPTGRAVGELCLGKHAGSPLAELHSIIGTRRKNCREATLTRNEFATIHEAFI